jgi:hypothetical protein
VDAETVKEQQRKKEENNLDTEGTFGPILSTVILDAGRSELTWSRWEQGARGPRAVFRYAVPREKEK